MITLWKKLVIKEVWNFGRKYYGKDKRRDDS